MTIYLKKYEINNLIKNDEELKEGYEDFKKNYPGSPIIDMYSNMHNWKPIVEVTIKFRYGNYTYYYDYYHEENEKPIHTLRRAN